MATAPERDPALFASAPIALLSAAPIVSREEAKALHVHVTERRQSLARDIPHIAPASSVIAEETSSSSEAATSSSNGEEPYYWEDGGDPRPPPLKLITHNAHWLTFQIVSGAEYVGEIFSEFFGLFNARYEWAVQMDRNRVEEMDEQERREEQQKRWELIRRMNQQQQQQQGSSASTGPPPTAGSGTSLSAPAAPAPAEPAV